MKEDKELALAFIEHAEEGEHSQFQFIRSWQEYLLMRNMKRSLDALTASLRKSAKNLFTQHCSDTAHGESDSNKLIAYCICRNTLEFYKEERKIVFDMMEEYEYYLFYESPLDFIFNLYRPEEKLRDYRE